MDVDVERTVEQLHWAILAVEHPNHDQAEAIATLKRLIVVGERELGPVTDWRGVPALQVRLLSQVEMAKAVLTQRESRR